MFGRRAKSAIDAMGRGAGAADPALSDTALSDTPGPIREEGAGHDAGLAEIEAEFTISDTDLALLDLPTLAFDQVANTLSAADTKMVGHRRELDDFMGRLNASCSERAGVHVDLQPYFMIPERCWEGDHQEVLVEVLGLTPAQPWNVLPLAGDPTTAETIGVPVHPGSKSLDSRQLSDRLITEAVEKMHATFERAAFAGDSIDTAALTDARAQAAHDIMSVARPMAETIIGTQGVDHTRALFFGD